MRKVNFVNSGRGAVVGVKFQQIFVDEIRVGVISTVPRREAKVRIDYPSKSYYLCKTYLTEKEALSEIRAYFRLKDKQDIATGNKLRRIAKLIRKKFSAMVS